MGSVSVTLPRKLMRQRGGKGRVIEGEKERGKVIETREKGRESDREKERESERKKREREKQGER